VYEFGGLNTDGKNNYTILEAKGHGHYVGCLFSVYNLRRSPLYDWYGEGDDMIFVDGEPGFQSPGHKSQVKCARRANRSQHRSPAGVGAGCE